MLHLHFFIFIFLGGAVLSRKMPSELFNHCNNNIFRLHLKKIPFTGENLDLRRSRPKPSKCSTKQGKTLAHFIKLRAGEQQVSNGLAVPQEKMLWMHMDSWSTHPEFHSARTVIESCEAAPRLKPL